MQRLALFDLDNTLIDLDEAFQAWAEEFTKEHGLEREAVDWLLALDRAGFPHREIFFGKVRERFALPDTVEELWGRYRRRMPHLVHCRPEVLAGLSRLRASGWLVAIVTNGTADNQLEKIRNTGLADAVDAWALSGVEGIRKPEARLFEIAAQRCPPWQAQVSGMRKRIASNLDTAPHADSTDPPAASRRAWAVAGRAAALRPVATSAAHVPIGRRRTVIRAEETPPAGISGPEVIAARNRGCGWLRSP
ncbi:HAD family hydrolase [Streptosporangium sp. NPDC002721]|uniref:HAD family hydrolase n=1 Tax=Streptosporangium sp. NPDC002721 TaxID=3366188 RepID=UPI003682A1C6